jgi:hypothetical protein
MADFISDKQDGFLYDYQEYPYLAQRIVALFGQDELCRRFSEAAIAKATRAHDRDMNLSAWLRMYEEVASAVPPARRVDFADR